MVNPTPEPTLAELLAVALEAVDAAKAIILHYYQSDVRVELKADQSPVTIADQEAEATIIRVVRSKFPDHGFFGEETGATAATKTDHVTHTWIIDPIDGTKNFIRQIPLFGTQLAVMRGDELVVGVSSMPAIGELMYATRGGGAYLNRQRIQVSAVSELAQAAISQYGYEKDKRFAKIHELSRSVAYCRGFGDCYSYHLVASGRIDAAFEPHIRIWDIAPFAVIIPEAGGMVSDEQGNSINLETRSIIASNAHLHDRIRSYLV